MATRVRPAIPTDLESVAALLDLFAADHPAAQHPRPLEVLREVFFGANPLTRVLVAERGDHVVGFVGWRPVFDMFWAMHGGEADSLFVRPEVRGLGIAPALIASMCADIRAHGGSFLRATYGNKVARFYERVAEGTAIRECHLSASAFAQVADLAGRPARELARGLPMPALNHVEITR